MTTGKPIATTNVMNHQNNLHRAQKLFSLPEPAQSTHWGAYIQGRKATKQIGRQLSKEPTSSSYVKDIHCAVKDAIRMNLSKEEVEIVHKSIDVTDCYFSADRWENLTELEVITRIHSIHSPKSVDIHLTYHYNEYNWMTTEWSYSLGFRINDTPVKPLQRYEDSGKSVSQMHRTKGWKPFGWFYMDADMSERSQCPIRRVDLERIHDALFGYGGRDSLLLADPDDYESDEPLPSIADRITLKHTAQLILAAVGIQFWVSDCEWSGEDDGYDRFLLGHKLDARKPGISAAHLRKICNIPRFLADDATDRSQIQTVYPEEIEELMRDRDDDMGASISTLLNGVWADLKVRQREERLVNACDSDESGLVSDTSSQ